ncbi:MAG: hypothetical protein BWY88_01097 [Synergistetes bacterium ADurb.Bin520]|nr:MAG: hypothetical protein BWY88_01097 [Synergistetes bacterium ADurb.Bin520]
MEYVVGQGPQGFVHALDIPIPRLPGYTGQGGAKLGVGFAGDAEKDLSPLGLHVQVLPPGLSQEPRQEILGVPRRIASPGDVGLELGPELVTPALSFRGFAEFGQGLVSHQGLSSLAVEQGGGHPVLFPPQQDSLGGELISGAFTEISGGGAEIHRQHVSSRSRRLEGGGHEALRSLRTSPRRFKTPSKNTGARSMRMGSPGATWPKVS